MMDRHTANLRGVRGMLAAGLGRKREQVEDDIDLLVELSATLTYPGVMERWAHVVARPNYRFDVPRLYRLLHLTRSCQKACLKTLPDDHKFVIWGGYRLVERLLEGLIALAMPAETVH